MILAVDTGGTFTDLLLLDGGELRALKVPSTPHDPAEAVLEGIRQLLGGERGGGSADRASRRSFILAHGSTVATNALLERKGARVFLVTNRGFEDVIEIGRQNRPQLYALVGHRPPPLVARADRIGIGGRIGPRGEEIEPLDRDELAGLAARLEGAESVAVSLLHAYADPRHEEAVRRALEAAGAVEAGTAAPGSAAEAGAVAGTAPAQAGAAAGKAPADAEAGAAPPLSLSSALLPEYREYERTSTTVVNAYVAPVVSRYLGRLDREAGASRIRVMGSNGGALSVRRAMREPVHTVLSGPAGGVVGALEWARRAGHERILTFDMGGTSTDVSLCPGRPLRTREFEIGGQPVAIPVLDIHTVGAGGGSLARVDPGGALRVGPESAGAVPGPIAYGRGGIEPTVTDAHVWLGRLPPEGFLGGAGTLDREVVREPLERLAAALGTTPEEAASGILSVVDSAMERALRVISVERGYDPADFALVAFGGAGGLHVAGLAERLGADRAIVPPDPGLLSAFGMLVAPPVVETSRTVLVRADPVGQAGTAAGEAAERNGEGARRGADEALREHFATLEAAALERIRSEVLAETPAAADERGVEDERAAAGTGGDRTARKRRDGSAEAMEPSLERWVDARYAGQSFELRVPAADWVERFHALHRERYGYDRRDAAVEAVTLRVVARLAGDEVMRPALDEADVPPRTESARVYADGRWLEAERVRRVDLRPGHALAGPALVLEYSATTWVPAGWSLRVDPSGNMLLDRSR